MSNLFRKYIHFGQCSLATRVFNRRIGRRFLSAASKNPEIDWSRVVFSGIQPTGGMHIGNYFGAIKQWVELQNKGDDVIVSIVDLHSITLPQEPASLQKNILEMAAYLVGCGLDPERCTLFLQSTVPRHAELSWILACIATMARLSHLPQFKEKSANMKEVPLGLMIYPVLQAADILLYKTTHVPVGEDQLQHLQMAAQLVKTFNHRFGQTFPSPVPILSGAESMRLRSLRDPFKKMSKSDVNPKSRIQLSDSPETVTSKIKKAVTDFTPQITYDTSGRDGICNLVHILCLASGYIHDEEITYDMSGRPGISNLVNIHCLASGHIPEEAVEEAEFLNSATYKAHVAKILNEHIGPIREKAEDLLSQPEQIRDMLQFGAAKARRRADETMTEVNRRVGIGLPVPAQSADTVHVLSL